MYAPAHCCQSGDRGSDQLRGKKVSKLGRWNKQEGKLDYPKEEVTKIRLAMCDEQRWNISLPYHALSCDTLAQRNVIGDIGI